MRLLIAEDDPRLLKSLIRIMELNNLPADGVSDGISALAYVRSGEYDGLILDIMMPKLDGLMVLKTLRAEGINIPTLFLTAKAEVSQRVEGLDAGADDYLPKPFVTEELLARVRAMLRRRDSFTPELLSFSGLTLNCSTYEIYCGDKSLPLCGKEFQILRMFMSNRNVIISTEQLITHIWGWDTDVDTSVVWVHISNLRKKLEAIGAAVRIRFVRNAGYLLEATA